MSYKQCLSNGLNEGLVTKEQYDEQLEFIGMQERFYKGQGYIIRIQGIFNNE